RVMVLAAGLAPDSGLADALARCGFPVFAEAQSNLPSAMRIARFDRFLDVLPEDLVPEIVVTIGGALVSARIKNWLRQLKTLRHISVGYADQLPDTFGHLAERVDCPAEVFFSACAKYDRCREYGVRWRNFYENCPLPSPNPISKLFESISSHSAGCDIWLSNGSAIRYAQHCRWDDARVDCNRGVSGIDGCTSTAIGSAMVSSAPTILITGDMSAGYDIGVLLNCRIPETFKIIILDNNGADIFRNISTTGSLDELDSLFVLPHQLPYSDICRHFGGEYYEAEAGKDDIPEDFFRTSAKAMLVVRINPEISKNLL
ncbi:MAG: hypothetical protein K2F63_05720, partial [Muribaculaceae bacterium]|nr:hypothetical protein [Muribaculaceae bacterium]